jgi:hypothetical protein
MQNLHHISVKTVLIYKAFVRHLPPAIFSATYRNLPLIRVFIFSDSPAPVRQTYPARLLMNQ